MRGMRCGCSPSTSSDLEEYGDQVFFNARARSLLPDSPPQKRPAGASVVQELFNAHQFCLRKCFTWIWEERLMEFVNTVILRRTRDLEAAIQAAKIDYEWRIHQLELKIEAVSRDLEEARKTTVELEATVTRSFALVKRRDTSIFGCVPSL